MDPNRKLKILVVDDDEEDFMILQALLSTNGDPDYDFHWEATPDNVLELACSNGFDLTILNHKIDSVTGIDLLDQIRRQCPGHPVIMISGYAHLDLKTEALQRGAAHFLLKDELTGPTLEQHIVDAVDKKNASTR